MEEGKEPEVGEQKVEDQNKDSAPVENPVPEEKAKPDPEAKAELGVDDQADIDQTSKQANMDEDDQKKRRPVR